MPGFFYGLQTRLYLDAMTGQTCEFSALQRKIGGIFGYFFLRGHNVYRMDIIRNKKAQPVLYIVNLGGLSVTLSHCGIATNLDAGG